MVFYKKFLVASLHEVSFYQQISTVSQLTSLPPSIDPFLTTLLWFDKLRHYHYYHHHCCYSPSLCPEPGQSRCIWLLRGRHVSAAVFSGTGRRWNCSSTCSSCPTASHWHIRVSPYPAPRISREDVSVDSKQVRVNACYKYRLTPARIRRHFGCSTNVFYFKYSFIIYSIHCTRIS